ncbi:unnamed protein product [Paramecium sonneborni]|uniref:Uncharacterized protein n=1 Tax=Paramecium sonneborni TaxID=65129 RepID=A0A8S1PFT3_9CILI|nr:unnamed protein product [Paramecium sonneborni]
MIFPQLNIAIGIYSDETNQRPNDYRLKNWIQLENLMQKESNDVDQVWIGIMMSNKIRQQLYVNE